jgi:RHS repeat-associated protein
VTSRTDALGRQTQYTYDATGNVTSITDPLGNVRTFTYDPVFNQVTAATDPLGNVTTYRYDPSGNLTSLTDPLGQTTTFSYNAVGQPVSATDALGNTTTFGYDSAGNLTATIDPLGNRTERTYDAVSQLIAVKDPKGAVTRFTYDAMDRLVSTTDALGGVTSFTYDPNGNLLTVTDARGNTTTHTYDARNRLATRTDPLGRVETFTYDFNGNLKTLTDRKGQVAMHTYDAQDRRIRSDFADGSFVTYEYDPTGRLLTATDSQTGTIARSYDALNRVASEVTPQGAITYSYDPASRRQSMQVNGLAPVQYTYDANSRLTEIQQGPQTASLTYDSANRRTSLTLPNGITVVYAYDDASRLVAQNYAGPSGAVGDLTYQYNATGDRIGTGGSWARTLLPASIPTSNYDQANEQLAFGEQNRTFDPNGNLLTRTDSTGLTTYAWDTRNQLIGINGPSVTATFTYDALGRRLSKTVNGDQTYFQYDGLDTVRESGSPGEVSYLRTLSIDGVLSRSDASGTSVFLADILGSIVALADWDGSLITTYTYAPFGETGLSGSPSSSPFGFTGREQDLPDLYYYRARYYAPQSGRFISEDPRGFSAGINFYSYGEGAPTIFTDPLGLEVQLCHRPMQHAEKYTHTYLYSTGAMEGWGLAASWWWAPITPFKCVPGIIEPDKPYNDEGRLKPGHQCTRSDKDPCVERCVIRKAREQTQRPPRYCLGRYQCQDWAEGTLKECRVECGR